eukprot:TRINITY_DN1787_c1_g1_i1.p7 TRINITY_DN1787_c1_g1~~TRINITY_DN1787_c1_g1_i1.p7  ORF type:complete len:70 (+),score=8.70 TRINITY_DN1787_c1_g1_i1:1244-1453(+)
MPKTFPLSKLCKHWDLENGETCVNPCPRNDLMNLMKKIVHMVLKLKSSVLVQHRIFIAKAQPLIFGAMH